MLGVKAKERGASLAELETDLNGWVATKDIRVSKLVETTENNEIGEGDEYDGDDGEDEHDELMSTMSTLGITETKKVKKKARFDRRRNGIRYQGLHVVVKYIIKKSSDSLSIWPWI